MAAENHKARRFTGAVKDCHDAQWNESYSPNHFAPDGVTRLNPAKDDDFNLIWSRIKEATKTYRVKPVVTPFFVFK